MTKYTNFENIDLYI
jgi:hypothetical protein